MVKRIFSCNQFLQLSFLKLYNFPNNLTAGMSPTAAIHVPLLPGSKSTAEHGTIPGAVFNVATSIIGSGIMSIPAILKVLGVFPSFALILIVAVLAEISVDFLMRFTDAGAKTTYAGVMKEAFGPVGALTTKVFVIINNFGGLILLLIITGIRTNFLSFLN
jgi:amino acid permease